MSTRDIRRGKNELDSRHKIPGVYNSSHITQVLRGIVGSSWSILIARYKWLAESIGS